MGHVINSKRNLYIHKCTLDLSNNATIATEIAIVVGIFTKGNNTSSFILDSSINILGSNTSKTTLAYFVALNPKDIITLNFSGYSSGTSGMAICRLSNGSQCVRTDPIKSIPKGSYSIDYSWP